MNRRLMLGAAGFALAAPLFATRGAFGQTVDELLRRKKIVVGMLVDIPPFGSMGPDQKPVGYDADVAALMAKYMGVDLELVPVTGPNRIPYLLTNRVDVLVATFGITPERAKQVWFSIPYSVLEVVLMGARKHNVSSLADAKGLRIAVARASTQDLVLTQQATGAQMLRFDDDATAGQALIAGRADLLGCNHMQARQLAADNPALELENKVVLSRQWQGITLRRGQTDLLQWVNTFLYFVKNNGELNAINRKWFDADLPPMPTF